MLSVEVPERHHLFAAEQLPELSIRMCRTSYLVHGSCPLHPPIPVESVRRASSASAETSPCAAVPFWWLCPSPSRVRHLGSACPAQSLHHPHLPHPPHRWNLQDHSDRLRWQPASPQTSFRALCMSIPRFQHASDCPALAEPLPLRLQLAFLPQQFLFQHNPQSSSLSLHCLRSAFLVVSLPQASFWISSCAMPQVLGLSPLPSRSCVHSHDDVVGSTAFLICAICQPEVVKSSFRSIDHCSLRGICCWARCWMLQVMDNMEACCVFHVNVGTFTHLEQSKISLLTVNKSGIVTLTIQHDMIVSVIFMHYPGNYLRQTSPDVLSLEQHPINILQLGDSGGRTPQFVPVTKHTTSGRLFANCGAVGNPCNLQPYSAGFILSITIILAAIYSILTRS